MIQKQSTIVLAWCCLVMLCLQSCQNSTNVKTPANNNTPSTVAFEKKAPDWYKNAVIYEVNVRHYTPEGTLKAFATHLPRLKELGVDVLWLMPIYPISKVKRKGIVGSPYAVHDYKAVNPDFGTTQDLDQVIQQAHQLGMKVILDFVPNHTGWDHVWMSQHKDWYTTSQDTICHPRDNEGKPTDWYDVADLNYDNREMRAAMLDAMKYWVKEHDIDGYRMDVAGFVPNDFWEEVRPALQSIKPILMLAEWEDVPQHFESCFEINYGWAFHKLLNNIAQGKSKAADLTAHYTAVKAKFPADAAQLLFITNHDENTWNGTEFKRMGKAVDAMAALTFTYEGVPLIYSGQEMENKKQLPLFEKDVIDYPKLNANKQWFYQKLTALKHRNSALWNSTNGAAVEPLNMEDATGQVYAFKRQKEANKVIAMYNFGAKNIATRLIGGTEVGKYTDVFSGKTIDVANNQRFDLPAWGFLILEKVGE